MHKSIRNETEILQAEYLIEAIKANDLNMVKLLLSQKGNVNAMDKDGYSALAYAAFNGYNTLVKELIAAGANVNHLSRDGFTPLLLACEKGHRENVVQHSSMPKLMLTKLIQMARRLSFSQHGRETIS